LGGKHFLKTSSSKPAIDTLATQLWHHQEGPKRPRLFQNRGLIHQSPIASSPAGENVALLSRMGCFQVGGPAMLPLAPIRPFLSIRRRFRPFRWARPARSSASEAGTGPTATALGRLLPPVWFLCRLPLPGDRALGVALADLQKPPRNVFKGPKIYAVPRKPREPILVREADAQELGGEVYRAVGDVPGLVLEEQGGLQASERQKGGGVCGGRHIAAGRWLRGKAARAAQGGEGRGGARAPSAELGGTACRSGAPVVDKVPRHLGEEPQRLPVELCEAQSPFGDVLVRFLDAEVEAERVKEAPLRDQHIVAEHFSDPRIVLERLANVQQIHSVSYTVRAFQYTLHSPKTFFNLTGEKKASCCNYKAVIFLQGLHNEVAVAKDDCCCDSWLG